MIRILIFILVAVFFAGLFTYLAAMNGRIEAEAFGLRFDLHAGFAVGATAFLLFLTVLATSLAKDAAALPRALQRREADARRARGVAALTRGFEAIAEGDAGAAQAHAKIARKNLEDPALTRLLTAEASQLAGDAAAAREAFEAMLEAPQTEFLGLRGLYALAMRADDKGAARGYAERAFRLRANAGWAFGSVLELGLDRGAWGETREAIATARKNGLVSTEKAKRGEAALLAADAHAALASGDAALALEEADRALKLAPGLAPAAVLAARLHADAGKRPRAAKILLAAFALAPHPALALAHDDLYKDEPAEKRAREMQRLAETNPQSREGRLASARRHMLLGEPRVAIGLLEPLLIEAATAREAALMAEAVAAAYGERGADAARAWLQRAAAAPRDPAPGAEGNFHFTRAGWALLAREFMEHGRLAPPPLEAAPPGLSADELRLLAPPPEPPPEAATLDAGVHPPTDAAPGDEALPTAFDGAKKEADDTGRAIAAAGQVS